MNNMKSPKTDCGCMENADFERVTESNPCCSFPLKSPQNEQENGATEKKQEFCGGIKMMKKCGKYFRWLPVIPITVGFILFLIGYYFDSEIIRLFWIILSGLVILFGTLGFIMMSKMIKK